MQFILNGHEKSLDDNVTVSQLLMDLQLEPIRVAVEINEDLVPRKTFDETIIHHNDRIEIVTFVGGG